MQNVRNALLIRPNAADCDAEFCIRGSAIHKGVSDECHGIVPPWHDKVADDLLVAVNDEVASKLFSFFMTCNKLGGRETLQVTPIGLSQDVSV